MQPSYRVIVNRRAEFRVTTSDDANRLCRRLADLPVLTANVYCEASDPTLDIIVKSGRAHVFYLDIERKVKLESRDATCTDNRRTN